MIGFSGDGDARLLSSMVHFTKQNIQIYESLDMQSSSTLTHNFYCLQDTVHIGTKWRNRLLVPSIHLPLGSSLISISHLKLLLSNVPKQQHGLVMTDICPEDRQNFGSLQKMMDQRVLNCLNKFVVGSEGTLTYLKICYDITSSLIDEDLHPEERIYRLSYSTYFIRAWRKWLIQQNFNLAENFISNNAYTCIEINATNLVLLARKFRNEKMDELFMPTLFNSQPNEEIFRQFRSMGTMNFTKINFTLLELFHLVSRVELQNEIVYIKLADTGVSFPRNKLNRAQLNQHKLPSDSNMLNIVNKAKTAALDAALKLGIKIDAKDIDKCDILDKGTPNPLHHETPNEINTVGSDEEDLISQPNTNTSSCIEITLENGTTKRIRKSTYLWTLTDSAKHLSNDRLRRVQETNDSTSRKAKRQLVFKKEVAPNQREHVLTLSKYDEIQIGDWSVFTFVKESKNVFVLGNIIAFKYIKGRTAKERQYSWEFAPVKPPKDVKNPRGIQVLATWFEISSKTTFFPVKIPHSFFINIDHYVISLNCQHIKLNPESTCLTFTNDDGVLNALHEQLSRYS